MSGPLLKLDQIGKQFGHVSVLEGISLAFQRGEIHALLGANGAGKSTLCKIISGLHPASSGTLTLGEKPYAPHSKREAEAAGIQIIQQELNLIPTLSVAENLFLNRLPQRLGIIRHSELFQGARRALDRFQLTEVSPSAIISSLGVGTQQLVEIASALDRPCDVLILDEPTAALSQAETSLLFDQLQRLKQAGKCIIYISHRLEEIAQIADRATVLRNGRLIATRELQQTSKDELIDLMSGTTSESQHAFQSYSTKQPLMQIRDLTDGRKLKPISFTVSAGERLGITGLIGAGRTRLLNLIFGAMRSHSGSIEFLHTKQTGPFAHPAEAVNAGLAMVTEDRKRNGLLLPQPVRSNISLSSLWRKFQRRGVVNRTSECTAAESTRSQLDIQCQSIEQPVQELSGGNQQKAVVGRWLQSSADLFLFDEPTRGIDIPARRRIYRLFEELAQAGKGLVIVSSDLEELFETCDRILVMSSGELVADFSREEWSEDLIMQACFSRQ